MCLPGVGSYRFAASDVEVKAFPERGARLEWILDAYQRTILPLALQVRGVEVLHASAIRMPQGVVVLCGVKETGKSTLAYALEQRGYPLWADDAVTFCRSGTTTRSLPLPFRIRLRPASVAFFGESSSIPQSDFDVASAAPPPAMDPLPLLAVCVLKRSSTLGTGIAFESERLFSAAALAAVLPHSYCFTLRDPAGKQRMMKHYLDLVSMVPVLEVRFQTGLENLPTILDGIELAVSGVLPTDV